jgi:hypothetical protein
MAALTFDFHKLPNQNLSNQYAGLFLFRGKNMSNDPVECTEVETSCGCTTGSFPPLINPGESFILKVHINKVGSKPNRVFSQSATFKFSNGQNETFHVSGNIVG